MIEKKCNDANLKQYLLFWYDCNRFSSYNDIKEINKGAKKKFMQFHKEIKYLLTL